MEEIRRIQDQLKRAFGGEAWHGPSVKEVLSGVTAEAALARPLPGAHCIWEIVLHIAAWQHAGSRMLSGESVNATPEQDWPPVVDQSAAGWEQTQHALEASQDELMLVMASFDDSELDQPVVGRPYSAYFLMHGIIQHDLYHAGQIALLRKGIA